MREPGRSVWFRLSLPMRDSCLHSGAAGKMLLSPGVLLLLLCTRKGSGPPGTGVSSSEQAPGLLQAPRRRPAGQRPAPKAVPALHGLGGRRGGGECLPPRTGAAEPPPRAPSSHGPSERSPGALHGSARCAAEGLAGPGGEAALWLGWWGRLPGRAWPALPGRRDRRVVSAAAANAHLCEGYAGPDGRPHAGFYCPRLSDPPTHAYCCRPGGSRALKSCCSRAALGGNGSAAAAAPAAELRPPLLPPLLAMGLYGCLVLALMAADLLHFRRRAAAPEETRPGPRGAE